ncbi:hypothetical protein [Nocardia xishanensis]|uniref:hypothetical protein n=1 Tax=Nocardia xishanensis TaxID=238964 RepID=UPI0033F3F899
MHPEALSSLPHRLGRALPCHRASLRALRWSWARAGCLVDLGSVPVAERSEQIVDPIGPEFDRPGELLDVG